MDFERFLRSELRWLRKFLLIGKPTPHGTSGGPVFRIGYEINNSYEWPTKCYGLMIAYIQDNSVGLVLPSSVLVELFDESTELN